MSLHGFVIFWFLFLLFGFFFLYTFFIFPVSCCAMFLLAEASGTILEVIMLSRENVPLRIDPAEVTCYVYPFPFNMSLFITSLEISSSALFY